jgi:hypothetical protein
MYNPSRDQVRQFFCDTWGKYRQNLPLEGLETKALDVILLHPEYHGLLADRGGAVERDYTPDTGEANPFLHLSLHLAVEEQLSIDQPPGISTEFPRRATRSLARSAGPSGRNGLALAARRCPAGCRRLSGVHQETLTAEPSATASDPGNAPDRFSAAQ